MSDTSVPKSDKDNKKIEIERCMRIAVDKSGKRIQEVEIEGKHYGDNKKRIEEIVNSLGGEIPAEKSELHKDGKLLMADGTVVVVFNPKVYQKLKSKNALKGKNTKQTTKGENR